MLYTASVTERKVPLSTDRLETQPELMLQFAGYSGDPAAATSEVSQGFMAFSGAESPSKSTHNTGKAAVEDDSLVGIGD